MTPELVDLLREDLEAAKFTDESVAELLGSEAEAARQRGQLVSARAVLARRGTSRRATLIRLFLLGEWIPFAEVDAALPMLRAEGALSMGLIEERLDGRVSAAVSLSPVRLADAGAPDGVHWWIISDLEDHVRLGPARADHVMGVGGATRSLIAMLPPEPVEHALDLGTGCGVVAMHLALRGPVLATDISERALTFAAANARLNRVEGITLRAGDLYHAVAEETFELIATNPPFVISPQEGVPQHEYRDAGLAGDRLAERVVAEGVAHLRPGGTLISLANWEYHWGVDGLERVEAWIRNEPGEPSVDAWIIERDVLDPAQYAELWARDGGLREGSEAHSRTIDSWLQDFRNRRVTRIGLGSIRIRRHDETGMHHEVIRRSERSTGPLQEQSLGAHLRQTFDTGVHTARLSDEQVLHACWVRSPELREQREYTPGQEHPTDISLVSAEGIERHVSADTLLAAAVGACDGELSLTQIAEALATLLELELDAISSALARKFRELAWLGFVTNAGDNRGSTGLVAPAADPRNGTLD